jgi:SAM-dependent methyltransferase
VSDELDAALLQVLTEALQAHGLIEDSRFSIRVLGGVAHLHGEVSDPVARGRVRRVAANVRGILAVWDLLELEGQEPGVTLDIGCGGVKQFEGSIGIDRSRAKGVDVVANLEDGLPIASESVAHVFAVHVLEHIVDLRCLLLETHRVLRAGGVLHAMVPNWRFVNSVADPTHVRFFDLKTFKAFCRPPPGWPAFRPLLATVTEDTVFADLEPVKAGEERAGPGDLARFFD